MQQHVYSISQACEQFGVQHAIICPGSRSAPLVSAFTQSRIHCISVLDERVAAYMALGMAQQTNTPVVIICTSGTAAINLYPGIAEAFYQRVPLIILTADRPLELLNQQDGQMVMQENLYGKHVLWFQQMDCYEHGKEKLQEVYNQTFLALQKADSPYKKGPVHLNIPLSEPLYAKGFSNPKKQRFEKKLVQPITDIKNLNALKSSWDKATKKIILVGQLPVNNELFSQLIRLEQDPNVVVIGDVLSNQQMAVTAPFFDTIMSKATPEVLNKLEPDLLISLGGPVLSKTLKRWLQNQVKLTHIRIDTGNEVIDTYRNLSFTVRQEPASVLSTLDTDSIEATEFKKTWQLLDELTTHRLDDFLFKYKYNELSVTNEVLKQLPTACNLHLANSSVIRYVSWLGGAPEHVVANGNRGTSGIDGCSSTAVGAAMVNNRLTVLLTGDLAFLYDRNAFWKQPVPNNLKIIVLNNGGGGIFKLIDGPQLHQKNIRFFTTPHQFGMKQVAEEYHMDYYLCQDAQSLNTQLEQFFEPSKNASLLEIKIDIDQNAKAIELFKSIKLI